tara:strand:+ start:846 stop:1133 length:288 start_codon:yes stop_codon:yes gene_type:complete
MPKGFKSKHGYATVKDYDGGADYRTIANTMCSMGYKMNHATARNVFLSALRKIAKPVHDMHGKGDKYEDLQATAKDPRFQSGVAEILESINRRDR